MGYLLSRPIGRAVFLAAFALVVGSAAVAAYAWEPPIGIPRPPFGIDEQAPPLPNPWNSNVPGFYYVKSGGTNSGNGYPGNPRATVPSPIPAGSVVVIEGTYTTNHEANPIRPQGTASQPVFIRGLSNTNRATITQKWDVIGSYYIIEYINGLWANSSGNGKLVIDGDHGVVRHGDFRGDTGTGIGGVHPGGQYMVIWNNYIHDAGDVNANFDQDNHCITVGGGTSYVWILDNEIARCSGDGLQINGSLSGTHHIYFGRNRSHSHKQTGMWSKTATDVIFSQNTVYNIRPSNSSGGGCTGAQYGPDYVWWLFNRLYNCESGIRVEGDSGMGASRPRHFFIGNLIYDITDSGTPDPGNPHASGAIVLRGGYEKYIVNNTLWNYQAGIMSPAGGFLKMENNILGARNNPQGRDIYIELSATANASTLRHSLFWSSPVRITWGSGSSGPVYTLEQFQSLTGKGENSATLDPRFVNAAAKDFHLQPASPAIDRGLLSEFYALFQSRYGIDLAKDIEGSPRPIGGAYDAGAYEYGGQVVRPTAPARLSVQ